MVGKASAANSWPQPTGTVERTRCSRTATGRRAEKRGGCYLKRWVHFVMAVGSAFVLGIVMKGLAMVFTDWMRDAFVLASALSGGRRRSAAKSSAMNAISARTPECVFLFSDFVWLVIKEALIRLIDYKIQTACKRNLKAPLPPIKSRCSAS